MANNTNFSGTNLNCQRQPERLRRRDTSNKLFKCIEKEGFYSVSETISEQDIISFAQKIISTRFERGTKISSPKDSTEFLLVKIGHYEHEVVE